LKYFGGDPLNVKEVSNFLNELEPILEKYNCGIILVHHTIKQSKQSRQNQVDSSYSGFGSSAWSNSVRETIEIRKANIDGYYKLITGKRCSKWGWKERYIQRSDTPTKPFWKDVSDLDLKDVMKQDKTRTVSTANKDIILEFIRPLPLTTTVQEIETATGMCNKSVRSHVYSLLSEKRIAVTDSGNNIKQYYRINDSNN
jgi:hypothetical protein